MLRFFLSKLILLVLVFGLFSCDEFEPVEFRQIRDLRVVGVEKGELIIEGNAEFFNPNARRAKLKDAQIEIFIKGKKAAHLTPGSKVRIKPNSSFEIPVNARLGLKDSGLLGNIFSILGKREMEIEFKGHIKVSTLLLTKKIQINDVQKVSF